MRPSLTLLAAALSAAPLFTSRGVSADTLEATRYDMKERVHDAEVRVDRGHATLVVRRTVENSGPKSDQALFMLDLPAGAVATRLRTAGTDARGGRVWFEGDLMEAEEAARKYRELTGIGGYYPKDPALLSWRSADRLALQVFPVPARAQKTVEYTLQIPLTYEEGAYRAELPQLGTSARSARLRVSAARPGDTVLVNGVPIASSSWVTADRALALELRPTRAPRIDGALASFEIAPGKHLVRARVAAAPRLGEAPAGAHVVVLFDNSRSMHARDAALAAVRAYLGHMSRATVDFVAFDRQLRTPIGRALPVGQALSRLQQAPLEPENGSRVDAALARADALLSVSTASARRVLLVTDTRTRSTLSPERIGEMPWKSRAVLHVGVVSEGQPSLARDDESPWATLPRRTGGLYWEGHAEPQVDDEARRVYEEWARPVRLDRLVVRGPDSHFEVPGELSEGDGLEHFVVAAAGVARLEVEGELWSAPVRASFAGDRAEAKRAAALAFGAGLHEELDEEQQMTLAMHGRVVSPVTSFLAIEPGVRPSTEGLDWGVGLSGTGSGGGGSGEGFGIGRGSVLGVRDPDARRTFLERALRAAAATCRVSASGARVSLETTLDEIVDIVSVELAPARDAAGERCIEAELWDVAPGPAFDREHEAHVLAVTL
jgi:hypothetical protein